MATLTLLDEYMLSSALIIGLTVLTHAIASLEEYNWTEPLFIAAHVCIVLAQHAFTFGVRTRGAAHTARELGFVHCVPEPLTAARWAKARQARTAMSMVRVFSAEQGKYVSVEANAMEVEEMDDEERYAEEMTRRPEEYATSRDAEVAVKRFQRAPQYGMP